MKQVRRANVILDIEDEQVEEYLAKGFDVINSKGDVTQACVPNDINVLRKAYTDHLNEIKELKAEIASLKTASKKRTTKKKQEDAE